MKSTMNRRKFIQVVIEGAAGLAAGVPAGVAGRFGLSHRLHGQVAQDHVYIQWNPNSGALKVKQDGTKLASKDELKRIENEHSRAVISPDGWKL